MYSQLVFVVKDISSYRCLQLPNTLHGWRVHAGGDSDEHTQWEALRGVFADHGYTLWETSSTFFLVSPGESFEAAQNGYEYVTPFRDPNMGGGMIDLYGFMFMVRTPGQAWSL